MFCALNEIAVSRPQEVAPRPVPTHLQGNGPEKQVENLETDAQDELSPNSLHGTITVQEVSYSTPPSTGKRIDKS